MVTTADIGYCDDEQRIIWVATSSNATLIHERCHAITGPYMASVFRYTPSSGTEYLTELIEAVRSGG